MPKLRISHLLLVMMLPVACTVGATQGQTPTTDFFAPTPTIGEPTTTTSIEVPRTTAPDIEKALLLEVDPLLNPAGEGIPMGDWWYGFPSPNQHWLIAQVGNESGSAEVRLVDLVNWRLVGSWPYGWVQGQAVTDDGIGYLVEGVAYVPNGDTPPPRLLRVQPGHEDPEGVAELPQGFSTWDQTHVDATGRLLILGFTVLDPRMGGGPATLLVFDPDKESLTEIPLASTDIGTVGEVDTGEQYQGYVLVVPGVVWDDQRSRVIVVNGDNLIITEVDLETGQVQEHPYSVEGWSDERPSGGATSSAALSPDGSRLFIARTESTYEIDETNWSRSTTSKGIVVIDTASWDVVDHLDDPLGSIALSPDGKHLLGSGHEAVESDGGYSMSPRPIIDLDPDTLSVRFQLQPPNEGDFSSILSFDPTSTFGYMSWWDNIAHVDVVDLETGQIVASREGPQVQVLGDSGLMGVSR